MAPLSAPHMHTDKAGILKGDNSGLGGRRASRTDGKGTSICWQSAKVMLRPQLMVMESSPGSCSRLLESLEATDYGSSNFRVFAPPRSRDRAKTWAKKRFYSHAEKRSQNMESLQQTQSFLKRLSKPFLKPSKAQLFGVREICGWPAQSFGHGLFH